MLIKRKLFARGTKEAGNIAKEFLRKKSRPKASKIRDKLVNAFNSVGGRDIPTDEKTIKVIREGYKTVTSRPTVAQLAGGGTEIIPGTAKTIYTPGYTKVVPKRVYGADIAEALRGQDDKSIIKMKKNISKLNKGIREGNKDFFEMTNKERLADLYEQGRLESKFVSDGNPDLLKYREYLKNRGQKGYKTPKQLQDSYRIDRRW